ncbi:MAG: MarR family transcriptional regulator [Pseudomonadota bacterium]
MTGAAYPDVGLAQTDAPELADERIAHLVRLCARGFGRSLQMRLADYDVSFGQWVFLRILWAEEGLSQREMADRAGLTEPTVHTALLRLEKLGYVERRTLAGNKRKQHTFLTDAGQALRGVLEPLAVEVNDRALAGLDDAAQAQFRDALMHVLENLAKDEAAARADGRTIPPTRGLL